MHLSITGAAGSRVNYIISRKTSLEAERSNTENKPNITNDFVRRVHLRKKGSAKHVRHREEDDEAAAADDDDDDEGLCRVCDEDQVRDDPPAGVPEGEAGPDRGDGVGENGRGDRGGGADEGGLGDGEATEGGARAREQAPPREESRTGAREQR